MALIALTGCDHLQSYLCKFADVVGCAIRNKEGCTGLLLDELGLV
jgi:hypothetical protein